jgi:opacity protein-like surface antigen
MTKIRLKIPVRIICAAIALSSTTTALAQEKNFNFELTPYGGYRVGGEFEETDGDLSIDLDDNSSFGFIFNARHSPVTQWEIIYSRQETSADTIGTGLSDPSLDLSVEYLQGGGTYLWDGEHIRPYLAATLGGTHINVSTAGFDSDTFFSFSLGLGLQIQPNSRLGLRLEARSFGTLLDSDTDIFCQSSPESNICAVRIDGTVLWQFEAFAGLVFRF